MEMDDIIIDINKAKDAGAILSAMALALTIPDMCVGDKSNRNDYIAWYNKYVNKGNAYFITGEECYALRCSFLHQGNADIDNQAVMKDKKPHGIKIHIKHQLGNSFSMIYRNSEDAKDYIDIDAMRIIDSIETGYYAFLKENFTFHLMAENIIFE